MAKDSDDHEGSERLWGINSVVLKSPWSATLSFEDVFTGREHVLVLNTFYCAAVEKHALEKAIDWFAMDESWSKQGKNYLAQPRSDFYEVIQNAAAMAFAADGSVK